MPGVIGGAHQGLRFLCGPEEAVDGVVERPATNTYRSPARFHDPTGGWVRGGSVSRGTRTTGRSFPADSVIICGVNADEIVSSSRPF